ncbi:MAG: peptidylprolyl isomerase [Fibrobacter sp.]|nr:peptidylprolyl isomerase [Fibrobacter sp.]
MPRSTVKNGDTILVDYTIRLPDGTLVGSTLNDDPVQFTVGNNEVIPGFENAALGMLEGETKIVELPPSEAYGPRIEELIQEIDIKSIPSGQSLIAGQTIEIQNSDNEIISATIINISDSKVKLDYNHFLAGKNLSLQFKVIEIL